MRTRFRMAAVRLCSQRLRISSRQRCMSSYYRYSTCNTSSTEILVQDKSSQHSLKNQFECHTLSFINVKKKLPHQSCFFPKVTNILTSMKSVCKLPQNDIRYSPLSRLNIKHRPRYALHQSQTHTDRSYSTRADTVKDTLNDWTEKLEAADVPEASLAVEYIISHILDIPRMELHRYASLTLSEEMLTEIERLMTCRLARMPLQYILGEWDFHSITLKVRPPVFIPRPETEKLVELALECLQGIKAPRILEIGCGSGAICLSLLHILGDLHCVAVDQSKHAIEVTALNAASLRVTDRLTLVEGKVTSEKMPSLPQECFDLIISNPPYMLRKDLLNVQPEIMIYEDMRALDGGKEGLDVIKAVIKHSQHLLPGGHALLLEALVQPHITVVSRSTRNQRAPGVRAWGGETLGIMGSLGGTVARSIESRGIVSGPSVGNLVSSGGGSSGGPSLAALSSAVAATHNTNSLFMANSIQATAATQQRAVSEMLRHMQGLGNRSLTGFVGRPYGSGGGNSMMGLHSNFGGDSAPPPLDLSEFPSLSSRNTDSSQPNPMAGRQPYVGMVKQPTPETSEFTMSSEDFPALPGSQANPTGKIFSPFSDDGFSNNEKKSNSTTGTDTPSDLVLRAAEKSQSQKRGIQTSPDGKVTNIPGGMVTDQFGMVGLLTFIRAAETDHNLVSLALGSDLTTLGLNLNSPENLYPNFAGPWAETPCRPQDIDYHVPQEYLTNQQIRGKLAPVKFDRYGEDLLFYMFYSNAGDLLQILAASELYNRDWRYHKEERVWITRAPGMAPVDKGPNYERGTYFYFDAQNWRKVPKEFHLEYDKLEERPHIPTPGGLIHTPTSSTL